MLKSLYKHNKRGKSPIPYTLITFINKILVLLLIYSYGIKYRIKKFILNNYCKLLFTYIKLSINKNKEINNMKKILIILSCKVLNYYLEKKLTNNLKDAVKNNITFRRQLTLREIKRGLI